MKMLLMVILESIARSFLRRLARDQRISGRTEDLKLRVDRHSHLAKELQTNQMLTDEEKDELLIESFLNVVHSRGMPWQG